MNRSTLLIAALVLAYPATGSAQSSRNTYVRISAGVNHMQPEDVEVHLDATPNDKTKGTVLTDNGPAISLALGFSLMHSLRMEVEGDFRSNHIKGETGLAGENSGTGTERKTGLMTNVLYDIGSSRLTPFIGGGIGAQFVHEPDATSTAGGVRIDVTGGTHGSFAYQGIGGASLALGTKGASVALEYRYLGITGKREYKGTATVPGAGVFPLTDESESDANHTFMLGVRFPLGH